MKFIANDGEQEHECETLEDALKVCNAAIQEANEWCDPQWPGWVNDISISHDGKIIMVATETNVNGPDGEIDEDGLDAQGRDFSDVQYYCDYEMRPVK